ncbi:siphovirus Gp157 family protein [Synechococcus sp. PCC 7502]|uniref:siphovirus Gp157 family protein n=1 Tax=Synechococcus sp. PCC 7502 TaxID=1173263 RepID=UPI00059EB451|nr:siphovirus Gp157 family protein [Synechococcus sp. PCC 7502]
MNTLIEISRDLIDLEQQLEDLIDNPEAQDEAIARYLESFNSTIADRDQKLDNYAGLIQELQARADVRKAESDRLSNRSQIDENKVKALKSNLKKFFEAHKLKTVETDRYRLTLAKNGGKAPMILDDVPASELPEQFTYREIDRVAVRQALDKGEVLDFARLGDRGQSLRIK